MDSHLPDDWGCLTLNFYRAWCEMYLCGLNVHSLIPVEVELSISLAICFLHSEIPFTCFSTRFFPLLTDSLWILNTDTLSVYVEQKLLMLA